MTESHEALQPEEPQGERKPVLTEDLRVPLPETDAAMLRRAAQKLQTPPNAVERIRRSVRKKLRNESEQMHQIQDMPAASKAAARSGYFTEGERIPQSFKEVRADQELERAYEIITDRAYDIFDETEAFRDAVNKGELGDALAETFDYITKIHTEGVKEVIIPPIKVGDEVIQHRIIADYMQLWVSNGKEHKKLTTAVQGLQASPDTAFSPIITEYEDAQTEGLKPVKIENLTETKIREFNTVVRAIRRVENSRKESPLPDISLNENTKRTLSELEADGETVDPQNRTRLLAKNEKHQALKDNITATYPDYEGEDPPLKPQVKNELDVTDQAAALGDMRRGFNTLIRRVRGGRHLNLETDPDESKNLPILEGLDLRRELLTLEEAESRVGASRVSTRFEKLKDATKETAQDMKTREGLKKQTKKGGKAAVNVTANILGGLNPFTFVPWAVDKGIKAFNFSKHYPGDLREYQRRKEEHSKKQLEELADNLGKRD